MSRRRAAGSRGAIRATALLGAVALFGAAGCTADTGPEAAIRALLEAGERAAEARDAAAVVALVSPEYADAEGRTRADLARLVRGWILLHPDLELLVHVAALEVESEAHARVELDVGLVARRGGTESVRPTADLRTVELRLRRDGGEWRVIAARWQDR